MRTIRDEWEDYCRSMLRADILRAGAAGEVVEFECRRAFYAGCAAMSGLLTKCGELGDDEATAHEVQRLFNEVTQFGADQVAIALELSLRHGIPKPPRPDLLKKMSSLRPTGRAPNAPSPRVVYGPLGTPTLYHPSA